MISIVIPLYNKESSIIRTLESVKEQTFTDYECLIINDGSTDKSADVVRDVICNMAGGIRERFHLIEEENGGVCSARNRGIKEAKSELVAFLDADDLWGKDYLKEQIRMVTDFPDCSMWSINYAETAGGKVIRDVPTGLPNGFRGIVDNYFELPGRVSDLFHSSSVVIRKEVFEEVGYFDERMKYSEDDDMWWRILAEKKCAFYDKYMVYYQQDTENRADANIWSHKLKFFLPYFVGKYAKYKTINPIFYCFVNRWSAIWLTRYYFGKKEEREDVLVAAKGLDYSVISPKYGLYFKTPYWIAYVMFRMVWLKNGKRW